MLNVVSWLWGSNLYGDEDVRKLRDGLARNIEQPYRFTLIADRACPHAEVIEISEADLHLTRMRGCFARLRLFDPRFQNYIGADERIVCIDLDVVVTGPLDPLFDRPEPFVILQGANASNPCPVNGSLWMLRAGYRPDVWTDFSLEAASKVPFYEFPDDQSFMHDRIPDAAGWEAGPRSGVYAFKKPGWPKGDDLPADARLVVFPGWRSPDQFQRLDWVKRHWK